MGSHWLARCSFVPCVCEGVITIRSYREMIIVLRSWIPIIRLFSNYGIKNHRRRTDGTRSRNQVIRVQDARAGWAGWAGRRRDMRLDRNTTGLVVLPSEGALHRRVGECPAHRTLSALFRRVQDDERSHRLLDGELLRWRSMPSRLWSGSDRSSEEEGVEGNDVECRETRGKDIGEEMMERVDASTVVKRHGDPAQYE